jgi:hypothetical protein
MEKVPITWLILSECGKPNQRDCERNCACTDLVDIGFFLRSVDMCPVENLQIGISVLAPNSRKPIKPRVVALHLFRTAHFGGKSFPTRISVLSFPRCLWPLDPEPFGSSLSQVSGIVHIFACSQAVIHRLQQQVSEMQAPIPCPKVRKRLLDEFAETQPLAGLPDENYTRIRSDSRTGNKRRASSLQTIFNSEIRD